MNRRKRFLLGLISFFVAIFIITFCRRCTLFPQYPWRYRLMMPLLRLWLYRPKAHRCLLPISRRNSNLLLSISARQKRWVAGDFNPRLVILGLKGFLAGMSSSKSSLAIRPADNSSRGALDPVLLSVRMDLSLQIIMW